MAQRRHVSSGGPWEEIVGYSRAVRVGPHVWVAGSTAMTPAGLVGAGDAYAQAAQAFRTIAAALEAAGSRLGDVVRSRMYVTDIADFEAVARAHREAVGQARPAATLVQVAALVDPRMLVEIEVEAYAPD